MKLPIKLVTISVTVLCLGDTVANPVTAEDKPLRTLQVQEPTGRLKAFMRKKLVASEDILEGLTTPNYALVRKGATAMIHMSKEAMWESHGGPSYAQDSADFVRTAERLVKLSNAQDLEARCTPTPSSRSSASTVTAA